MTQVTGAVALRDAIATLRGAGIENAPGDARRLLAHALQVAPNRLTLALHDMMTAQAQTRLEAALAARCQFQPVAQITGKRLFWGAEFSVTPDTLDPRPETEILVAQALKSPFDTILDLGTGTGCILLSCLADMENARGIGTDISAAALQVAQQNAQALGLGGRAQFLRSDWYSAVTGRFDLIVSNPPYIAADEMAGLSRDVLDWEPHGALTPGGDGLAPYRILARQAPAHLTPGGRMLLEIGPTQGQAVSGFLRDSGLTDVAVLQDLDGRDRVVTACSAVDTVGLSAS
ncbi:protein-(glutamine-N5) methyltransferase, release factor-specific [Thioclava sp. SK-1]|uniref:peptide chain release factor N(5)-glutamine methyltransferase n=1 Tax=Thioclava sp. SK-1 TaxID=1889770 RepID=UPI00082509C6|nr:peptide chain release factor N(5)-glutamine methyltransferase [Thioclava sp. SK-1]OCX67173.1 protein-(glutamine-N5) methyltransferase, release factor-specific [Thioclava sp. SK-1]